MDDGASVGLRWGEDPQALDEPTPTGRTVCGYPWQAIERRLCSCRELLRQVAF